MTSVPISVISCASASQSLSIMTFNTIYSGTSTIYHLKTSQIFADITNKLRMFVYFLWLDDAQGCVCGCYGILYVFPPQFLHVWALFVL